LDIAGWRAAIVRDGALVSHGMPQFAELSDAQLDSLRHYVRAKAREALGGESAR
jgi:quinohemoprotein ethanol dehydrogenase